MEMYLKEELTDHLVKSMVGVKDIIINNRKYIEDNLSSVAKYLNSISQMFHNGHSERYVKDNCHNIISEFLIENDSINKDLQSFFIDNLNKARELYLIHLEKRKINVKKNLKKSRIEVYVGFIMQEATSNISNLIVDENSIKSIITPAKFRLDEPINIDGVVENLIHLEDFYFLLLDNEIKKLPEIFKNYYENDPHSTRQTENYKNREKYLSGESDKGERHLYSLYIFYEGAYWINLFLERK